MIANPRVQKNPQPANRTILKLREVKVLSQSLSHTYYSTGTECSHEEHVLPLTYPHKKKHKKIIEA